MNFYYFLPKKKIDITTSGLEKANFFSSNGLKQAALVVEVADL